MFELIMINLTNLRCIIVFLTKTTLLKLNKINLS